MRKKQSILIRTGIWLFIWLAAVTFLFRSPSFWRLFFPLHYQPLLERYGNEYQVDPLLLAAVIRAESKYHAQARSEAGALGLMQILPETGAWAAKKIGIKEFQASMLLEPETNIRIGAWYLHHLLEEFQGDIVLALAAYNSGRGNVEDWLAQVERGEEKSLALDGIPFPETRTYVRKVLRNYHWYRKIYEPNRKRY